MFKTASEAVWYRNGKIYSEKYLGALITRDQCNLLSCVIAESVTQMLRESICVTLSTHAKNLYELIML